jgi:hypothetical protein
VENGGRLEEGKDGRRNGTTHAGNVKTITDQICTKVARACLSNGDYVICRGLMIVNPIRGGKEGN